MDEDDGGGRNSEGMTRQMEGGVQAYLSARGEEKGQERGRRKERRAAKGICCVYVYTYLGLVPSRLSG